MEKACHGLKKSINGLEKGIVRHLAPQMLPEALNRIELWGIGRQGHQLNLFRMSRQESKNGFGKMNAIVIDTARNKALSLWSLAAQYNLPLTQWMSPAP